MPRLAKLRCLVALALTILLLAPSAAQAQDTTEANGADADEDQCGSQNVESVTFTGEVVGTNGRRVIFRVNGEDFPVRVEGERNRLKGGQSYEVTAYDLLRFDSPVAFLDATNCVAADVTIRHADGAAINTSPNWLSIILWTLVIPLLGIGLIIAALTMARRRVFARRGELPGDDFDAY